MDTICWITFEGKKNYVVEDLASIEKKIEIKESFANDAAIYGYTCRTGLRNEDSIYIMKKAAKPTLIINITY